MWPYYKRIFGSCDYLFEGWPLQQSAFYSVTTPQPTGYRAAKEHLNNFRSPLGTAAPGVTHLFGRAAP